MSAVTPQMVKELREMTGAGMADCKKALDQASGDLEGAVTILRERGLAAAAKKSGRAASEGMVSAVISSDSTKGFLVEINCETDFVTRNEEFQGFVAGVQKVIAKETPANTESLLACTLDNGEKVQENLTKLIAKIGENLMVRRYVSNGNAQNFVTSYVHGNGKVGVLVELAGTNIGAARTNPALQEMGKDVALQIAAMKPLFLKRDAIPAEVIKQESEIFHQQYKNQGKPDAVLPKIVASRMDTWFKEACLVDQLFVKDDAKTVGAVVTEAGKKLGVADLHIVNFHRMELGEGVEKKTSDLASEVAAQIADANK